MYANCTEITTVNVTTKLDVIMLFLKYKKIGVVFKRTSKLDRENSEGMKVGLGLVSSPSSLKDDNIM